LPGSISRRFRSTELGSFFQPLDLDCQSTDLFVKFLLVGLGVVPSLTPVLKQSRSLLQQFPVPGRHLVGMHRELAGQLSRRLVAQMAATATFALKADPKNRRFLGIRVPPVGGTLADMNLHLIGAPSFRGPPHSAVMTPCTRSLLRLL
jgi:hypothetical protein